MFFWFWDKPVSPKWSLTCAWLNYDLFRVVIVSHPSWRCSAVLEHLNHFFLGCPMYLQVKSTFICNLNRVATCYALDIKFLTCDNVNLTYEQNCIIFKYVSGYIKCSKRFFSYNWNWIGWTCTSYDYILIYFSFYLWLFIIDSLLELYIVIACLLCQCTSLM
jgi:hypothetical protein